MEVFKYNFDLEYEIIDEIDGIDYSSKDFKEFWSIDMKNWKPEPYEVLSRSISLISDRKIVINKEVKIEGDFSNEINFQLKLFSEMYSSEWKGYYQLKSTGTNYFSKRFESPYFDMVDIP